jgi:hypothetical protein
VGAARLHIFLSYHTPDRDIALALKDAIEKIAPDTDVFVDQTHLRHGHLWQPALFEAIAKAQAFLILISNRLGDWQKVEYYEARDRKARDDDFTLLPVIIADRSKGPPANLPGLAQLHWIETMEPIAPEPLGKIMATLQSSKTLTLPAAWRTINPYRGLLALEEQDSDFFFGRDHETSEILDHLIDSPGRLLTLVGNSGVGKSSLVQAGVIGALKGQRWPGQRKTWSPALTGSRAWTYVTIRLGNDPIAALTSEFTSLWFPDATDPQRVARRNQWSDLLRQGQAQLSDLIEVTDKRFSDVFSFVPPPRIFLYIDQGEELFTRTTPEDRKRFSEIVANGLAQNSRRLTVMISLRADYYGDLQANPTLFAVAEKIDIRPLSKDGLTLVLQEPARLLGASFESGSLVAHVIEAAVDQPSALPLLADLFTDLWERMRERADGVLRIFDRQEIIQIGTALIRRADGFLAQYPDKVEAVKSLFTLRLAHVQRQGPPVRARMERGQQTSGDQNEDEDWALVALLAGPDWRLVVTGETDGKVTAEVAHEILLTAWPTLKRWLDDEREFLSWKGDVEYARRQHDAAPIRERRGALLMGRSLAQAQQWLSDRAGNIAPKEIVYIKLSARRARGFRALAVGVVLTALAGLTMLGSAAWLTYRATPEKRAIFVSLLFEAEQQRLTSIETVVQRPAKLRIFSLSFVDRETRGVLDMANVSMALGTAIDAAMDTMVAIEQKAAGTVIQIQKLAGEDRAKQSLRLNQIYWDPNMSGSEKVDLIIESLMKPDEMDVLVSGQYGMSPNGEVNLRPYVIDRTTKKLTTESLTFATDKFYCLAPADGKQQVVCPEALQEIRDVGVRLLKQL